MNSDIKILIAVPSMDMVAAGFASSLATLTKVGKTSISFICSSLVYDSRNKLAMQAIQGEYDYIMWFDSDMIFKPDTMVRLLADIEEKGCDIVSGVYFRRSMPYTPVVFSKIDISEGICKHEDYKGKLDGLVEVEGVGFGCVLMKTEIIFQVFAKYTDCFSPIGRVGEDLSFCWRARQLGYKIHTDFDVKCGHVGSLIVTQDFFESIRGAKNET